MTPAPATTPASAPGPGSAPVRRSQKERAQDDLVMSTNSSSIVSKRSVERIYYPQEPHFFRFFVKKFQRRSPLINRGYHIRLHVIDVAVRDFLARPSEKRKVVVNLGCGSDVLPWQCLTRYPKECQGAKFIDIDFPDLMAKKRAIVEATPELHAGLTDLCRSEQPDLFLQSEEYVQIGCDLRELARIQQALAQVVDIATSEFIFVAEVSITYMETKGADAVIEWAAGLGQAEFCLLEQVLPDGPDHPFAETMLRHFDKLKTPLKSVHAYPDLDSQRRRFLRLGWPDVHVESLWDAWSSAKYLSSEQRKMLNAVEPFDEWEEFAIFGSHYCVMSARTGRPMSGGTAPAAAPDSGGGVPALAVGTTFTESAKSCQRRFGACLTIETPLGGQLMANTLGLGSTSRLRSLDIYAPGPAPVDFQLPSAGPPGRMCHTMVPLGVFGHLLVGGRTSPSTPLQDCWLFDGACRSWNRVADLPVPLYRHSATRLGSSGLALVMGGKTGVELFPGCLLYHPETGWAECEISGADYKPVFGAVLIAHSVGTVSDHGGICFQGVLAGGLYEDGTVAEQRLRWELRASPSSRSSLRFSTFDQAVNGYSATKPETSSGHRRAMERFGATVAYDPRGVPLVIGGVGKGGLLPRDQEILRVELAGAGEPRVKSGSVAQSDANTDNKIPQPLLLGISTGVTASGDVVIMGGGATCFSMGTYWNKGVYSCRVGSAQTAKPAWRFDRALELTDVPPVQPTKDAQATRPDLVEIPRVRLDATNTFSKILQAGKPVIIEKSDLGGCVGTWTPEHLIERVGAGRHVVVHEAPTSRMDFNAKNFRYVTKEFANFVREAEEGGSLYLRALSEDGPTEKPAHLSRDFPALAQEFRLPQELSFVEENTFSSVLRVSGRANMWLHYDVMANVYCQVTGSKRLFLFPPTDVTALSFAPGASSSSVDVLARGGGPSLAGTHPHEAVLNPGEILFLPPLWLHAAEPRTDFGVAVNVFFRDLEGGYASGRDVYGNRDLAAYEKGRQDVARIVKGFDNVPQAMREFYVTRLAAEMMGRQRDRGL